MYILVVYAVTIIHGCFGCSCDSIKSKDRNAQSGIYTINLPSGVYEVYCEMGINGGGYTFLPPNIIAKLTAADIAKLWERKSDVLLRLANPDGSQPYTVLKSRSKIALSVQINNHTGFQGPINKKNIGRPYLFLGTPSNTTNIKHTTQGFISNNQHITYRNCDGNPNAYFAFFPNPRERPVSNYHGKNLVYEKVGVAVNWRHSAKRPPSTRRIPETFFMFTEMHYGGCGCYTSSDRWMNPVAMYKALGTAIGLR